MPPAQAPLGPIPDASGATPAMAQWFTAKAAHPDALVFFRMGDFYELFFADAEAAAAALDIALSFRGEHRGQKIAMCGVPAHAHESYLARLIRQGFRVAICDQMETPEQAKARKAPTIRRDITRLVTAGTVTEETLLEAARPAWLLALAPMEDRIGAAWLDVSTGAFGTESLPRGEIQALLARLEPAEILAPDGVFEGEEAARITPADPPRDAARRLAEAFDVSTLDGFGSFSVEELAAAAMALDYVRATQAGALPRLAPPSPMGGRGLLQMDAATRRSLEILKSERGEARHSLLAAVDRTVTAAGARELAARLASPLADVAPILARHEAVGWMLAAASERAALRAALKGSPDMARALARLSLDRFAPRDLAAIRDGLARADAMAAALDAAGGLQPALIEAARGALVPEASPQERALKMAG